MKNLIKKILGVILLLNLLPLFIVMISLIERNHTILYAAAKEGQSKLAKEYLDLTLEQMALEDKIAANRDDHSISANRYRLNDEADLKKINKKISDNQEKAASYQGFVLGAQKRITDGLIVQSNAYDEVEKKIKTLTETIKQQGTATPEQKAQLQGLYKQRDAIDDLTKEYKEHKDKVLSGYEDLIDEINKYTKHFHLKQYIYNQTRQ